MSDHRKADLAKKYGFKMDLHMVGHFCKSEWRFSREGVNLKLENGKYINTIDGRTSSYSSLEEAMKTISEQDDKVRNELRKDAMKFVETWESSEKELFINDLLGLLGTNQLLNIIQHQNIMSNAEIVSRNADDLDMCED